MIENAEEFPLITVITPSYNSGVYIFDAIDSVIHQTYPNIEYIITDDGSSEFPETEIKNIFTSPLKSKNITTWKIICNSTNQGTVKNLNGAIRKSSGKYLFFLAADDVFYNQNVLNDWMVTIIRTNAEIITSYREKYDEKLTNSLGILPNMNDVTKIKTYSSDKLYEDFFRKNIRIQGGGCLAYSRECLIRYNLFNEAYVLSEDIPAVLLLLRNNVKLYFWDGISIKYREGGVSSNFQTSIPLIKDLITRFRYELTQSKFQHIETKIKIYLCYASLCFNLFYVQILKTVKQCKSDNHNIFLSIILSCCMGCFEIYERIYKYSKNFYLFIFPIIFH